MKEKRYTLRISNAEIELFEKNLPPEISNLAELFRTGAKRLIDGEVVETQQVDIQTISELIIESDNRVISEIHQNRSVVIGIQRVLQDEKKIRKLDFEKIAINDLVNIWLKNPETLQTFSKVEELENSIEYDHLKEYCLDALEKMERDGLVKRIRGKLVWSL